jgi:hypothetical protein
MQYCRLQAVSRRLPGSIMRARENGEKRYNFLINKSMLTDINRLKIREPVPRQFRLK